MLKILMIMVSCLLFLVGCNQKEEAENFIKEEINNESTQKTNSPNSSDNNESEVEFEKYQASTLAFDTIIDIVIYSDDEQYANEILKEAEQLCFYYDDLLNKTKDESLISKLNKNKQYIMKKNELTEEDEILLEIIEKSLHYSDLTNGYFDITIEPLVKLWGIGDGNDTVPSAINIEETIQFVNYGNVQIKNLSDDKNEIAIVLEENTTIDVGGIAKGFIADEIKQFLESSNISHGLLNFGGNVITIGSKPNGDSYLIGIREPEEGMTDIVGAVDVIDKSVVTSGVYERYFKVGDTLYHHIIDPKTGYPSNNDLLSVTIISDKSIDGDAFSTSVFLLGLKEGLKLVDEVEGIEAMFITKDSEIFYSENFESEYKFSLMK